jgi:tol-pal system protein YbgF
MTRHLLSPRARPLLSLTMFALFALAAGSGEAQDRSTQERLDRLERDLNMLQRQVYRGGGIPAGGGDTNIAVDTQIRMDRLEAQMRDLTGRVEDQTNEVRQLRQRIEQINSDMDVRFSQDQADAQGPRPRGAPSRPSTTAVASYGGVSPVSQPPPDAPPPRYGALRPPDAMVPGPPPPSPPMTSAAAGGSLRPPGSQTLPSGSASDQYNTAFGLVRRADYPAAEEALRAFVRQHPDDPLAGNAQYWLGETYFARGRYAEAASAFAEGYKRYAKGAKAPETMLKLGMSLARENQTKNACVTLSALDHTFPHAASTLKEQAAKEKKRLGC